MGKKIPLWQCLLVLAAMVGFLMWGILKDSGGEAHMALVAAAIVAAVVAVANGWKWNYMEQGILAAINRSMQACLILAIVGSMIASWMAAGTIPTMMYYGIKIISPSIFLFTACLLCSIVALATGSSWSTAGSMGVALIGVGTALGFPPEMTAGAVVSGAYFGDKMSPLSDTTNLAPAIAGATLFDHVKHMIWTTGPSLCIALVIYLVLGFTRSGGAADTSTMDEILTFITDASDVNLLFLLPPVFVIGAVILKLPAIPALIGGVLLGLPFMAMQGVEVTEWMNILNNGISLAEVPEDAPLMIQKLGALLVGKGCQGMFWTIS
ncbi:MAG: sodium:proton antiporter, partial [Firmicutes bacterium]|nr:sodium:proton antiporter [Bacillota bacterium]